MAISCSRATSSAPTGAASSGTHSEVRWSGSKLRSSSDHATSNTDSSASPSRCRTVTAADGASSTASFTSDRTRRLWQWATKQRAPLPGGALGEAVGIDQPDPVVERIDAEADPRQVQEGDAGQHLQLDLAALGGTVEQLDASFEHPG